ncbi:EcsC family protein [Paludisphaera mucosa]|uniref:EcsC family protein n=1 Tax=Paludisphaera mucosa TaxID=3030827 RepID=A0ABT6FHT0_9BACT|nr:EcsC family protein [Paludisphaera mucosa]MDG3007104.1 EcsC family protein [Paludisphaera mucosa]
MGLTAYERRQVGAIAAWKGETQGWGARAVARVRRPLARLGESLIPDAALRKVLDGLDAALEAEPRVAAFLAESGVESLEALKLGPLERCDRLADRVGVRAERLAMGMGAVAGAGGLITELAGLPLLLAAALRAIHRTGLCYGYNLDGPADRSYLLGVLELSTVDDPDVRVRIRERLARLARGRERPGDPPVGLDGLEGCVAGDLALEAVPFVGDPVAIVLDYMMMRRVDRTARMVFRERWLRDAGRIEGEIAPAPPHPRDDALRAFGDLAGQAAYVTGFGLAFGVVLPLAAARRASRRLPDPVVRGAREGALAASRAADDLRAGWSDAREILWAPGPEPAAG